VQVICQFASVNGWIGGWLWWDFVLIPNRISGIYWFHTFFSAGFLHSQYDATHVLGNILVIALVGVPLEQRLGTRRFALVYGIGLFGGSFAWFLFNSTSGNPSLGASGAAFGLFGAYLAGWPKDEIPFPLILIRKWPVLYLALFYFAMEVFRAYTTLGLNQASDVAHMAHLGGFLAAYLLLPVIAKNGPYPLGIEDGGPTSSSGERSRLNQIRSVMVDMSSVVDPWTARGIEIPRAIRDPLRSLLASADEPETRLAWMEHLADAAECPDCQAPLGVVERASGPQLQCSIEPEHLNWPE
jgi:membrane associated rhomboid family serine protease